MSVVDERTGHPVAGVHPDFSLTIGGVTVPSSLMPMTSTTVSGAGTNHVHITWRMDLPEVSIVRTVDVYAGIAGFRSQTAIRPITPLALGGYTLDELSRSRTATTTLHAFHAGADWREPEWSPSLSIGDAPTGDWRTTKTSAPGGAIRGTAQWISATDANGVVGMVAERRDYESSIGFAAPSSTGTTVAAGVDLSRDVVYLGPFEEDAHIQNPSEGPARQRLVEPLTTLELEPVFTSIGRDADDEVWQYSKYLTHHRLEPYKRAIVFNSDGVDSNAISTGAKDDMNFDRFKAILPSVRAMGMDTFVFDDGWMARSGDWCPDSPTCTEPRWDGVEGSKFRPRFPDDEFKAVRQYLRDDPRTPEDDSDLALGLWMTPMAFHPSSKAFRTNPQWSCAPVGTGTAGLSIQDPNSGSNEPGIGLWNPRAIGVDPDDGVTPMRLIDYIEGRILRAIEVYGATYFKFDFLVWVDCGGVTPVTMYEYRDEFAAMIDRLQGKHPEVTYQVDDTNDYRMFPFETIARGPSWFLNGGPTVSKILHTVWNLQPYVPGSALGLRAIAQRSNIDTEMAAAIMSHLTFSLPVDTTTTLTETQRAQVRRWNDFYAANRQTLGGFAFPLLADPAARLGTNPDKHPWTALQPWDVDARSGWLLAYRQDDTRASVVVPLRGLSGIDDATLFTVTRVDPANPNLSYPDVTFTASELRAGIPVSATISSYAIYRIVPVA